MELKIRGSNFSGKLANKYLNIHEWVEVVEENINDPPSLHLLPRELWVYVKENPNKKNKHQLKLGSVSLLLFFYNQYIVYHFLMPHQSPTTAN